MSRSGAILIPLVGGFLLTLAIVTWRSGGWQQRDARGSVAAPTWTIEPRRSPLRIVHIDLTRFHTASAAAAPTAPTAPASLAPAASPEPDSEISAEPPAPRVDPGNSPELLEAPARKFARGGHTNGD